MASRRSSSEAEAGVTPGKSSCWRVPITMGCVCSCLTPVCICECLLLLPFFCWNSQLLVRQLIWQALRGVVSSGFDEGVQAGKTEMPCGQWLGGAPHHALKNIKCIDQLERGSTWDRGWCVGTHLEPEKLTLHSWDFSRKTLSSLRLSKQLLRLILCLGQFNCTVFYYFGLVYMIRPFHFFVVWLQLVGDDEWAL